MKYLLVSIAAVFLSTNLLFAQDQTTSAWKSWRSPQERIDSIELLLKGGKGSVGLQVIRCCEIANIYNDQGKYHFADSVVEAIDASGKLPAEVRFKYLLTFANTKKFNAAPVLANDYYEEAIDFALKVRKETWAIEAIISHAEFFRKYQDYDQSQECLKKAFEMLAKYPKKYRLWAYAHNRKAAVMNERFTAEEALHESLLSVEYASRINDPDLLASSYNELGYIYNRLGVQDSVVYYYEKSEKAFRKAGKLMEAVNAKFNRVFYLATRPKVDTDQIIVLLQDFIDEIKTKEIPYSVHTLYKLQYQLEQRRGNYKKALEYYELHANESHRYFIASQETQLEKIRLENRNTQVRLENQNIKLDLLTQAKEIQNKNWVIYSSIAALILLGGLVLMVYRNSMRNKKFSQELEKKNQQKDFLLQEVHHRVKNNLDFIQSLLMMQASSSTDDLKAQALKEANTRLTSISMVHEMLYNDESENVVDVKLYVRDLMDNLLTSFNGNSPQVRLDISVDELYLGIQDCTALGLLLTECFTNSMKHAFDQIEDPFFKIDLSTLEKNHQFTLTISDNGKGKKESSKQSDKPSLGMRLIDIFSRQLKGEYTLNLEGSFTFQLKVPTAS